ncbi:MAG TPA: molybdate ABC transporter substrate-binding protein [Candidatus Aphodovivens avistercoris]|nr:molybdate ABC transporter substrate-binding protein [Candidatus Aphodovivens avistercoris]
MKANSKGRATLHGGRILVLAAAACAALLALALAGCSSGQPSSAQQSEPAGEQQASLEGKELNIYCGAGMTDPFQKIAEAFEAETGCTMNVTYANAAQIQTQITTTEEGDFFIAGSADELGPVADYVEAQTDLVQHIPVLAVPADNPKNVTGLADLASCERVLVGDPEATPIGKIAQNALTKLGLWDELSTSGVITTTTTAPQISTALANGEGDAGIVWKENVTDDGAVIVDTADLDAFVKTIPAAQLTCAADADAVAAFNDFLQSDAAWDIWAEFGYERV